MYTCTSTHSSLVHVVYREHGQLMLYSLNRMWLGTLTLGFQTFIRIHPHHSFFSFSPSSPPLTLFLFSLSLSLSLSHSHSHTHTHTLPQLSPIPVSQQHYGEGVLPIDPQRRRVSQTNKKLDQLPPERDYSYSIPLGAIPLLATEFHDYGEVLKKVASKANQVYQDFLKSDEGRTFTGQVQKIIMHAS